MKYAPVIIPTLDRYKHLKKCLESLENCCGADKTDVYIALDYPPSEKYIEGWKKNDAYLHIKEKNNKFRTLTVYRRETNYFFSGKGNARTAINDLPKNVDRYIFSEDDNVFSPNFLEFINKGLEKFERNPNVLAVCGYNFPYPVKVLDNNYYFQNVDFSAWGYGIWKKRSEACDIVDQSYLKKKLKVFSNIRKLRKNGLSRLLYAIQCAFSSAEIPNSDNTLSIYMALEDMYVVMPTKTKVRNEGWDGSGIHCDYGQDIATMHNMREIDSDKNFDYKGEGMNFYNENKAIYVNNSFARCSYLQFFKSALYCLLKAKFPSFALFVKSKLK